MRLTILAAGALLLPLAACNQGPSTEESARATGEIRLENASMEEVAKQAAAAGDKAGGQPGQWENHMQIVAVETGDAPTQIAAQMKTVLKRPAETAKVCNKGENPLDMSKLGAMARGCSFPRYVAAGGKIDARMECEGPFGKTVTTMAGSQGKTEYDITMKQAQTIPGQSKETSVTYRLTGKRLGECKA